MNLKLQIEPTLFARLSKKAKAQKISIRELAVRAFGGVFTPPKRSASSGKSVSL